MSIIVSGDPVLRVGNRIRDPRKKDGKQRDGKKSDIKKIGLGCEIEQVRLCQEEGNKNTDCPSQIHPNRLATLFRVQTEVSINFEAINIQSYTR